MVPTDSHGISRVPRYSGLQTGGSTGFAYGTVTLCGRPFHAGSTTRELCNSLTLRQPGRSDPTTPHWQRLPALPPMRFRLYPVRSPLLRVSRLLSLPSGTEMFHFPEFPLPALCVQAGVVRHDPYQVCPFGNPRIDACLAASRGLSQPATSFIGFQRQGIHRVPFATCRDDARARYGVLKGRDLGPATVPTWMSNLPVRAGANRVVHCESVPVAVFKVKDRRPGTFRRVRSRILQSCTVCPHSYHRYRHWS